MAEFFNNKTESETTKLTLFFVNKSFHPRMGCEPIKLTNVNSNKLNANIFANRIEEV